MKVIVISFGIASYPVLNISQEQSNTADSGRADAGKAHAKASISHRIICLIVCTMPHFPKSTSNSSSNGDEPSERNSLPSLTDPYFRPDATQKPTNLLRHPSTSPLSDIP